MMVYDFRLVTHPFTMIYQSLACSTWAYPLWIFQADQAVGNWIKMRHVGMIQKKLHSGRTRALLDHFWRWLFSHSQLPILFVKSLFWVVKSQFLFAQLIWIQTGMNSLVMNSPSGCIGDSHSGQKNVVPIILLGEYPHLWCFFHRLGISFVDDHVPLLCVLKTKVPNKQPVLPVKNEPKLRWLNKN